MKELKFYGASDDLFECDGAIREEICMYSNPGVYHLKSSEGEMLIIACYTDEGCWAIGVGQVNEETHLPAWPASYSQHERGYSVVLTLQVPDDTELVLEDSDD
ncbi:hypothetical protein PAG72_23955 [Klebsiella pneumoniae]|uniref:hypothetical protein n=1 Tax=Klebsiella pneumoniae complex TaxID=3390273 RepID=UPI001C8B7598|nr:MULTISPECIES: hypothetical protein [Klebsiella]EKX2178332.1 hypothetical protein [Klebsiella pneumoniae]MBX9262600.1 hypothetical protein [Klebsiella pneumoniae]MBZ1614911.1 hypothetical protein [Klebsiella pneumoniae]MCE7428791.1 hypothetical protein [Klebsiella pneumoniae]MCQ8310801.1 hypothetical protein [Klebsiella pneumoniae]